MAGMKQSAFQALTPVVILCASVAAAQVQRTSPEVSSDKTESKVEHVSFASEGAPAEVAQKVGLRTRAQTDFYDLAIIGGGPAVPSSGESFSCTGCSIRPFLGTRKDQS
jgi:phenylacetate-coenzyme A ligase PaaK-like adenylate-forming protein